MAIWHEESFVQIVAMTLPPSAGRVCIRTDIDRQWVVPLGAPDDIREAVKEAIECFGRFDGGIILHGEIGPDVPLENIEALYSAFYEYGQYPLEWTAGDG